MRVRLLSALVLLLVALPCPGDVLHLKNGTVEGQIIEETDDAVTIRTFAGTVTLSRDQIERIERKPAPIEEYHSMLKGLRDDDIVGHYALGLWCTERRLSKQAREQFEHVLKLDPDHEGARKELGYERIRGRWLTYDEAMAAKGYVKYDGRWVEPKVAAQLEREEKQRQLSRRIGALLNTIKAGPKAASERALEQLMSIDDPDAIEPLARRADNEDDNVRRAVIDLLARIGGIPAADELARIVLIEPTEKLRARALDELRKIEGADPAHYFISALRTYRDKPVESKQDIDVKRRVLSRASWALGEIGEQKAVPALISVLVVDMGYTVTRVKRPAVTGPTTNIGRDFGPDGKPTGNVRSGRFIGGNLSPIVETEQVKFVNDEALAALRKITGEDFGLETKAWGDWWVLHKPIFQEEDPLDE